ncbi:MAG: baseplate J/gp47 family protein [Clostridiales Family XIII bacterium]|nr:baseplate J/gp47 family protein [Clostridiales Family XIII bacterium]
MSEAIEKIPMYTKEWTNFNVSDPGITILQNLSMFTALMREKINDVPESVRFGLLSMLGFTSGEYEASEVFLSASVSDSEMSFPLGEKFMAEDICFEADGAVTLGSWGVNGLYCENDGVIRDITYLRDGALRSSAAVFGAPATVGARFYVLFDDIPGDRDSLVLLIRIMGDESRNAFGDSDLSLVELKWQLFSKDGWMDVEATDETRGFLRSGLVKLSLGASEKALCSVGGGQGYALRCILKSGQYDISPRLHSITANVFEARQKDSKVTMTSLPGKDTVIYSNRVGINGYYTVFCDEEGAGNYRKYTPYDGSGGQGRFYEVEQGPTGIRINFQSKRFAFGPASREDAVRVVGCELAAAEHLLLGRLMGYDGQVLRAHGFGHILPNELCVLAEGKDTGGVPFYRFVRPGGTDERGFCYRVMSDTSEIQVMSPGDMEGYMLHIASCAVTEGARGDVRARTAFIPKFLSAEGVEPLPRITNALESRGGAAKESAEQLRFRFLTDLREPTVAVTLDDYEYIVKNTPGLCIHKVKAVADPGGNLIRIAVKPYGEEKMPALLPLYANIIKDHIDQRRMIGTRIELVSPVYIPVDVRAIIYVKGYYDNIKELIESYLRGELDGVTGGMPFGATISYNRIYKGLEALECVETLYEFAIAPRDWKSAKPDGPDIILNDGALCYPGDFLIEIR